MPIPEKAVDCCYALQDKIWVSDPNGWKWEVFVVKVADTRPDITSSAAAVGAAGNGCCAAESAGCEEAAAG